MDRIVINLDKPCQEFEVNGEVFKLFYDDESINKYRKEALKFQKQATKQIDIEKATEEEIEEYEKESKKLIEEIVTCFFGEGEYEKLYKITGKSIINMFDVVGEIAKYVTTKMSSMDKKAAEYYMKK